ncbi:MAG: response regulator [Methylococcales bacterium]|jgi:two-component system, sensor histidine kinase and response regulator|nr:response regulator [Methylococcales bacterium]MBT7443170.1 response regulator [Methylococcales bacterium]
MVKILVVDDNELNRELLVRRLKPKNYDVSVAGNGPEALEMIDEHNYDLVLLDIVMPGMDGLEVLTIIRQRFSLVDLPVIMVTAKDLDADIVRAFQLGANDYVTKPLNMAIALVRIEAHVRLKRLAELHKEFLGIASHDMKRPLALILDIMETISEDPPEGIILTENVTGIFSLVTNACKQMQSNITDYLDRHAMEDGRLKLVLSSTDLNDLIQQSVDGHLENARRKEVKITWSLAADLPSVHIDRARIIQVIDNFVGNAIKFSLPGSETRIVTEKIDGKIFFKVVDSGPGLSPEDIKKLFSKYAQMSAKPTGGEESTGLGLSICKQMIDLHEGEIGAENREGQQGSVFWFSLTL